MRFSYKDGCGVHKRTRIKAFKTRAGLAIDKWLRVISNTMLFKPLVPLRI